MAYLGLILAAFLALIVTLAWATWQSGDNAEAEEAEDPASSGAASSDRQN